MYNSLSALPNVPYNIISYLVLSDRAENLWKMLAYNSYDALSKPNLTAKQKLDLLWRTGKQENCSVFLTNLVEDAVQASKCILKIYNYYDQPNELYSASAVYAFDFLYGGQMSLVDYNGVPVNRGDLFISIILDTLNGSNVGGVGNMIWLSDASRYCAAKSTIGNSKTFTGVQLYLATMIGDRGRENGCRA